ncbi:succinate dehydrogenase, hydrophobic membrane anchor protein [Phaeovulum sp.]|uniref:succinate dehydrogenase, hydrophobic membrane anchor protein n=1 Tax=Phaeovulum sp. TaxID=2934796 RepID=UPI0039E3B6A9
MHYITDRKRAEGNGASGTGTEHHWHMQVSSVALAFLVPTFIYIFGNALGQGHEAVLAVFARPFTAILTALVITVSMIHFAKGATMMIEDYTKGLTRKVAVIATVSLSYAIIATGLFALAKIAL